MGGSGGASLVYGEANQRIVVAGGTLWRRVDGGLSTPAFWVERRRVLWRGSTEQAKGHAEWDAGV